MSKTTICPRLLSCHEGHEADSFEEKIIIPLLDFMDYALAHNIYIEISEDILEHAINSCPWNLLELPVWKNTVIDWYNALMQRVSKDVHIVQTTRASSSCSCTKIDSEIKSFFFDFMSYFEFSSPKKVDNQKGIFTNGICDAVHPCTQYIIINSLSDIKFTQYPWLLMYDVDLPHQGEVLFIPRDDWMLHKTPLRAQDSGYLDQNGNSWKKDMLHKDHWDVQIRNSRKHLNVTSDGRTLRNK